MNYITNKRLFIISLSSFLLTGCVTKTEFNSKRVEVKRVTPIHLSSRLSKVNGWKSRVETKSSLATKEDCVDCYAAPLSKANITKRSKSLEQKENQLLNSTIDYSKPPSESLALAPLSKKTEETINTYSYDAYDYTVTPDDTYIEEKREVTTKYVTPKLSYINTSDGDYSSKTAIQIGAFRRYAGAKSYAKKYALLSGDYHVEIKTGLKDGKPIHRVRIEGFSSRAEAKRFIARYGIDDAFLVRR